jgi:hypothetical protein
VSPTGGGFTAHRTIVGRHDVTASAIRCRNRRVKRQSASCGGEDRSEAPRPRNS